jgi:hypothetical protein
LTNPTGNKIIAKTKNEKQERQYDLLAKLSFLDQGSLYLKGDRFQFQKKQHGKNTPQCYNDEVIRNL